MPILKSQYVPDVEGREAEPIGPYLPDNVALVVNLNGPLSSYCCVMREISLLASDWPI